MTVKLIPKAPIPELRHTKTMVYFLLANLLLIIVLIFTHSLIVTCIQVGLAIGWAVGGSLSYKDGLRDEVVIIEKVYGEKWDEYAVLGRQIAAAAHN